MSVESDLDIKHLKGNFFSRLHQSLQRPVKDLKDFPQFAATSASPAKEARIMDGSRSAANKADTVRLTNFILGRDEENQQP